MEELLKELQLMSSLDDAASTEKMKEIAAKYQSDEEREFIKNYLSGTLDEIGKDIDELDAKLDKMLSIKQQIKEVSEIISLKYIAEHYFGKSTAWLSQRINGCPVRGKIYTLKEEELDTLNFAIHDIGKKLGSLSIS